MRNSAVLRAAFFAGALISARLSAAESPELAQLRAQVAALEQQLKVLARQIEVREQAAAPAAPAQPKITASDKAFGIASPDAANSIRLRGLIQLDARQFFADAPGLNNNAFVLRRARIITEGQFAKNYSFNLCTEFGGSAVSVLDANLTVALTKELQVKVGKMKYPVGHELLQSDSWTFFNERSIVTNLVPNRDLGLQAQGDLLGGRVAYQAGVFNGVGDGGSSTNTDFDEDKDVAGRVTVTPFKHSAGSPLQGLTLGLAGSLGREKTAAGRTSGYRTDGQQTFFAYNAAVVADGQNWRVSPQLDYRHGPFGLVGEYVRSVSNLRLGAAGAKAELRHHAWQLAAGCVLTGEDSSYNGVVPKTNFDLAAGTWGAFELVGRYSRLEIDPDAFPLFASPAGSAEEATGIGLGLNWYLSKAAMIKLDYYHTDFGLNALAPAVPAAPLLRQDEKALITRFQVAF